MIRAARIEAAPTVIYGCAACGAEWDYAEVHNIARCPACGGGLVRAETEDAAASGLAAAAVRSSRLA
jgi:DNA-directed RNA polymerase subunit RPC12/RpoP